jgi:hypothetical protein
MQTFLPYAGFADTALVLDKRRLGKQRVETIQVLRALTVPGYGWRHHPAAALWAGYEEALVRYGLDVCAVWCAFGNADTCAATLASDLRTTTGRSAARTQSELAEAGELPPWLGDADFHRSHRSALLRKDPVHYRPFFPTCRTTCRTSGPPLIANAAHSTTTRGFSLILLLLRHFEVNKGWATNRWVTIGYARVAGNHQNTSAAVGAGGRIMHAIPLRRSVWRDAAARRAET